MVHTYLLGQTYKSDMLNSAPVVKTTENETFPVVCTVRAENSLSLIGLLMVLSGLAEVSIILAIVIFCQNMLVTFYFPLLQVSWYHGFFALFAANDYWGK